MAVTVKKIVPEESKLAVKRLFLQVGSDVLRKVTNDFLISLFDVIRGYMTHTTRHGYRYTYTGSLYSSFQESKETIINRPKDILVRRVIHSSHPASAILQTGGEIRPKSASRLTVPISQKYVSLEEAQLLRKTGKLFLRNGKLYYKIGGQAIPLFVLKTVVRMPKYMYLSKAFRKLGFKVR